MLLLSLYLPIISFLCCSLFGFLIGRFGAITITVLNIFISLLVALIGLWNFCLTGSASYFNLGVWCFSDSLLVSWGFVFDSLSSVMLVVVLLVSCTVHMYSCSYLWSDPHLVRFLSYLSLFTFFMIVLILADNFLVFFLGWEGVGLCSYLLISFWYTRIQAVKAALKALIINRIGDFCVIVGVLLVYNYFQTLDFSVVFILLPFFETVTFYFFNFEFSLLTTICFFFLIGVVGKSAQIGLHLWLPDAMEGPTPVSALIHAATMVTAGVFLIIRCSYLFEYSTFVLNLFLIFGSLTALISALTGLVQNDIKKIIAYSTCSQLGYMVFTCGLSQYVLSFFHLVNHAFFKALLFLGSGLIIHSLGGEQDIRKMGGYLFKKFPFLYSVFLIGLFSLSGFPFLAGFYSKDIILEVSFFNSDYLSFFVFWVGTLVATLTAFYSFRLCFFVFYSNTFFYITWLKQPHTVTFFSSILLSALIFLSIFSGYLLKDAFVGFGSNFFQLSVSLPLKAIDSLMLSEFIPFYIKLIPIVTSCCGIFSALYFYSNFFYIFIELSTKLNRMYYFLSNKFYFDRVYNQFSLFFINNVGYHLCYELIEKGLLEVFGPTGFSHVTYKIHNFISLYHTGYVYHYACAFVLSLVYFLILFEFFFI